MRVHVYEAGQIHPVTLSDVTPEASAVEVLELQVGELIATGHGVVEIDSTVTIREILGDGGGHVVKHPCRELTVVVRYSGQERTLHLTPSTLLGIVQRDAAAAFGIDAGQAASLTLRLPGDAVTELSDRLPIGALTSECALVLDLGHIQRPQG